MLKSQPFNPSARHRQAFMLPAAVDCPTRQPVSQLSAACQRIGLVFVCAPWMLFCVWLPWIPQCRWIHKRKMPRRSALILTAMLAAFCLLALAVMVMFAVDAATSVDVGCHG